MRIDHCIPKIIIVCVFLILEVFTAHARSVVSTPEDLRTQFQKALETQNAHALEQLFYWQGVSPEDKKFMLEHIVEGADRTIDHVAIEALPDWVKDQKIARGEIIRRNLPALGMIKAYYKPLEGGEATGVPYGVYNGRYYLTATVREKIPEGEEGVPLNVVVLGNAVFPNPDEFKGECHYLAAGEKQTLRVHGYGNGSYGFWGQEILNCNIHNIKGDSPIGLQIFENEKLIYEINLSEAKLEVSYDKNN